MLRLTFLGTKGEVKVKSRKHQRHSCLLVEYKDTRLLIDFGADWKGRLTEVNPTHIALTHAHPDHAWGLTEETEIPVYARSVTFDTLKPSIRDNLKEKVRMRNFEPYKAGDLTIRAIPVSHSVNFPANGFIIEAGGRTIGYFPDVLHITNYKRILKGLDIYIGDGAYLEDKPGRVRRTPDGRPYGHALIRDQVRWASQAGVPIVIFTHFGEQAIKEPEKLEKAFAELSKEFNVQIIEAFDGMSYSLKAKAVYPGLYLVPPHARLIAEGKKTVIVSTKLPPEHYVNRPLLLIEDRKAYGFITITNVTGPHDADEVREKLRDKHQITDEEWNAWWKGKQQVFLYEFKFKPFDEPVPVSVPQGVQKFVRSVRIRLSAAENVLKLYEKLKDELPRYEDEVWLRDEIWFGKKTVPTMEHKLLMALSWLHRTAEQQLAIYHQVREAYDKLGKRFHEMQPTDVDKLPYPVDPPKRWLKNLVRFLKDNEMTFDDLCTKLKKLHPLEAKRVLQDIFGTTASKLIEVFMRDYLLMDAFPIDFHVANVLKKHKIPTDSDLIVSICHMYGIPVRPFARAVYSIGEVALVKPSTVKEVLKNPELLHKWTDAQLFDDHRICHMWAGKHWKTLPKDLTPEDVKRFHDLLLTEIQRRGLTFDHKTPIQLATEVGNVDNSAKVGELAELINDLPKGDHQSVSLTAQTPEEISVEAHKPSPYAEIHRYGQDLGRTVDIAEVLQYYNKPIILQKGYVKLVGSLANYGETKGDIDIRINEPDLLKAWPVVFRIGRALPPDLAWRVQFHDNRYPAFTSHVDLYDLALVVPEDRRLIRMATKGRIETIKDPVAKRQAWEALRTDTVKPLQYVMVLKGYRAHYKHIDQLTVEDTESWFGKEAYPIAVQMKYDGAVVVLMKDGDKVIIRTDAGFDVTKRLPTIVELARKILPKTVTLVAETEMWIGNKHQPREVTAGYLNAKTPPDDSNIVLNVFDIVYFHDPKYEHHELPGTVGDLHNKPYELRLRYLQLIDWPQSTTKVRKPGFNLAPTKIAHNPEELLKLLRWAAEGAASEGAVVKSLHMKYELDGLSELQLKWKKVGEIHAIVWKQEETKTPGVYTLYIAVRIPAGWKVPKKRIVEVDGKQYMAIGKTFNVAGGAKPGTIVSVTFHSLNWYINDRTGEQYIHIYEPKFAGKRPDQKVPDSAEDAVNIARDLELLTVKRLQWKSFMDDKPHKAVMQIHYRGKSISAFSPIIVRHNNKIDILSIAELFDNNSESNEIHIQGYEVWTPNGWEPILKAYRHRLGQTKLLRVVCHGGVVDVTEDHSLFRNDLPIQAKHVKPGESIDVVSSFPQLPELYDAPIDYAWVLGYFVADGTLYERGNTRYARFTSFDLSKIERVKQFCERYGISHSKIREGLTGYGIDVWDLFTVFRQCYTTVHGKRVKKVPSFVFSWTKDAKEAFLQGFIAGDGNLTAGLQIVNTSQFVLQGINLIAFSLLGKSITTNWAQQGYRYGAFSCYISDPQHPASKDRRTVKCVREHPYHGTWFFGAQNNQFVYDIETPSHKFIAGAGGIVCHNSAHMDFRIADAKEQYLLGYTVMVQKAGKIKEDVTSVEQAKRIEKNWDYYFKMSNDPQTYLVSPTRKLWVEYKGVEPKEWLNVEGAVRPGEVGATRYEWGVFSIVDKPIVYFGCVKPDFHELFIYGKKFTGRWVIRLLPNPWRCLAPETPIVTMNGIVKAEDVKPGDVLYTGDKVVGVDKLEASRFVEVHIEGNNEPIIVTDNHPFFVLRGKACKQGRSRYCTPKCTYCNESQSLRYEWVQAKDLRPFDYVVFPIQEERFYVGSFDYGRLIGWLIGDGCIRDTGQISIFLSKTDPVDDVKNLMEQHLKKSVSVYYPPSNCLQLYVCNAEWARKLRKLLYRGNTRTFPVEWLYANREFKEGLLTGLLEADGYNDGRSRILSQKDRELPVLTQLLVYSLGRAASLRKYRSGRVWLCDVTDSARNILVANNFVHRRVKFTKLIQRNAVAINIRTTSGLIPTLHGLTHNTEQPRFTFVKLMWKPEDQMPYVLSERAVEKQWMPPFGISALPPEIRKQIPREYQYWKVKDRRKAREIRDKLVEAIENGEVKIEIPKEWVGG